MIRFFKQICNYFFNGTGTRKLLELEGERIATYIHYHEERYHVGQVPLFGKSIDQEIEELNRR